jgi:ABC-type uncharacterized transport system substrate-binding protein
MKRRRFIALASVAVAWPLVARAQQREHIRQIGVLMGFAETDQSTQGWLRELRQGLERLGWRDGQNVQFITRYAAGEPGRARMFAKELVEAQPDLIVCHTTPVAAALSQATRTLPVVFVSITDPVNGGFVASMARPGGNMTGFTNYEFTMGAKWLEVLKEIAPKTTRVSLLLNPDTGSYYTEYLRSVEAVALVSSVQATLAPVHNSAEIESSISALARDAGSGLIVLPSAPITAHLDLVIDLAARHRIPAVYPFSDVPDQGGLVAYGIVLNDLFRRAADYVDRILRGQKAGDLPVQAPTKYELVVNRKTAAELGIEVPLMLLARADRVIE